MGGNALKEDGVKLRRMTESEYTDLKEEILEFFQTVCLEAAVIPHHSGKKSFGDMDILVALRVPGKDDTDSIVSMNDAFELVASVHRRFRTKILRWEKNSNVFTFHHQSFQIDIVMVPITNFQFALKYFSFNDLGNLLGRVAASISMKLGFSGLWYTEYSKNKTVKRETLITDQFPIALRVLGYTAPEINDLYYRAGYTPTMKESFAFVTQNPYFHKDYYHLENRNNKDRVRDEKRPVYRAFLKYIEKLEDTPKPLRKPGALETAHDLCPGFTSRLQLADLKVLHDLTTAALRKHVVSFGQLHSLKGPTLGAWVNFVAAHTDSLTHSQRAALVSESGTVVQHSYLEAMYTLFLEV